MDRQELKRYRESFLLLGVFALSVALRSFFAEQVTIVSPDGASYGLLAKKFLEKGFSESLHVYWSPLYPTLTGVFSFFTGDLEQAGRAVSVFFGGALVIPVYLLAKSLYGKTTAALTAILVAFYPFLIERSTRMTTESLYTFLFAFMLVSGWVALERREVRYFGVTGALLGLLYLTRTEAYAYVLLFILFGLLQGPWKKKGRAVLKMAIRGSALVFCFIAISSPYLVFIHDQTGQWSPGLREINFISNSDARKNFWTNIDKLSPDGSNSLANQILAEGRIKNFRFSQEQEYTGVDLQWILEAIRRLYKAYRTYQPTLLPGLVIVFIALGLFATPWDGKRLGQEIFLISIIACTVLGYSLINIKERYFACIIPIFLLWTAQGLLFFGRWLKETLHQGLGLTLQRTAWGIALVVVLVFLSFTPKYVKFASLGRTVPRAEEHKQAGLWVKANMGKDLTVMSLKPYVAFYGEGRHLYIPDEDYLRVLKYASRQGIDLLVIDEEWIPSKRPQLKFLLDGGEAPKHLAPVYENTINNRKIILYGLKDSLHRQIRNEVRDAKSFQR
jgi:4-amino-4-deoxy-L-arabinose transferase-like glycosyltransferase